MRKPRGLPGAVRRMCLLAFILFYHGDRYAYALPRSRWRASRNRDACTSVCPITRRQLSWRADNWPNCANRSSMIVCWKRSRVGWAIGMCQSVSRGYGGGMRFELRFGTANNPLAHRSHQVSRLNPRDSKIYRDSAAAYSLVDFGQVHLVCVRGTGNRE